MTRPVGYGKGGECDQNAAVGDDRVSFGVSDDRAARTVCAQEGWHADALTGGPTQQELMRKAYALSGAWIRQRQG